MYLKSWPIPHTPYHPNQCRHAIAMYTSISVSTWTYRMTYIITSGIFGRILLYHGGLGTFIDARVYSTYIAKSNAEVHIILSIHVKQWKSKTILKTKGNNNI